MSSVCIFIFRRDLRLSDNTAFCEACNACREKGLSMVPMFIFNESQINPSKNAYFSNNQVQFMVQSLRDLEKQLKDVGGVLHFAHAEDDIEVLVEISKKINVKLVAFNKDITPFALKRDAAISDWCKTNGVGVVAGEDYTLMPMDAVKTQQGKAYEVYTPFYKVAVQRPVASPKAVPNPVPKFLTHTLLKSARDLDSYYTPNSWVSQHGGRTSALAILDALKAGKFKEYEADRNFPAKDGTTKLSAALKFGCVSPREVYHAAVRAMGKGSVLVSQLLWREYYYNIAYHYPEVLQAQVGKKHNTHVRGRFEDMRWNASERDFTKWCQGMTGVPIVDAAMRCLNKTGWMHNRLRMIVAMYLVRDLKIDWRKGEKYFATQLVDYDAANNNQGWCWVLLYRHKLSPWVQTQRFDKDCEFIKAWVPELKDVPVKDILAWKTRWRDHKGHAAPLSI